MQNEYIINLESLLEALEPGGPVHDAGWNLMSSLRRCSNPENHVSIVQKCARVITDFSQLSLRQQYEHEDKVTHLINGLSQIISKEN